MEEGEVNIKKIITIIDDEKSYSIDVDETTTFYEFKKILAGAAHLLKNCFRIYHMQKELTNENDDLTIEDIFPNLNEITLHIKSTREVCDIEDKLINIKFNINIPCETHIGKYKMLYCFSCSKSICTDCFVQGHKSHKVEEKADYLAPAQLLMNNIFSNSSLYKADSRLSKYMECVKFRSDLKLNIFDNLRKLINDLEVKFASCLEYFSTSEDETEKNTNENLELLKKFCIEYFIKLKNDINTKGIIVDDEIFLTIYHKLKEIERYKTKIFEKNKEKYEKLNTLLAPFIKQVEKISEEIKIIFDNYLNKDIYETFKSSIQENMVEKIQKEQVNDLMFGNLGVPRKSLNRMSFNSISSYKKNERNSYNSPDKPLNQQKERNPFQSAIYSHQQQGFTSENPLAYNSSSNTKNINQNYSSYTSSKVDNQNVKNNLSMIFERNEGQEEESGIYDKKRIVTTTTNMTTNLNNTNLNNTNLNNIGVNRGITSQRVEEINKSAITNVNNINNINMAGHSMNSILNSNIPSNFNINANVESNMNMNTKSMNTITNTSNISNNSNIISSNNFGNIGNVHNIQKETTTTNIYHSNESTFPGQTTQYSKKKEFTFKNATSMPIINEVQGQKKITKTETTTTTITTNNIAGDNRTINNNTGINLFGTMSTNTNNNIDKNYSQVYQVNQYTTTNQQQIHSGSQQAPSSNVSMFGGKLVDVLNNEINKKEIEYHEQMMNQNKVQETHSEQIYGTDGSVIQKITKTQIVKYGNDIAPMFLFVFPCFNTNKIMGAFEDETTGHTEIDFKQAFGEKDIPLDKFPQGGAYCNHGKYLYFTGGKETIKGIGKIFLRLSLIKEDKKGKLAKMPTMLYNHWNHSMIANDNYVFVIGGYNSNKCECFNLKTLKWEAMPDLNREERQRPMLVIYKDYLYAFMGYTQNNILNSVERINISKLGSCKWEKVSIKNEENLNLRFYGAGIYNYNGKLFFIGGKIGQGEDENDYKSEIYSFDFNDMKFVSTDIFFTGKLNFIENEFFHCNEENIGNFIDLNNGCLATIGMSSLK